MICIKKDNIISNKTNLLEEEICVKKFHHQGFFYSLNITPKTFLLIPNTDLYQFSLHQLERYECIELATYQCAVDYI